MAKEVEYKHIAKYVPEKWKRNMKAIYQGYIHIDPKKQVRVRVVPEFKKAWMCIKFMDGNVRDEFEVEMDYQEGTELYMLCPYKLEKKRYSEQWGLFIIDLDEYKDGTLIVEIECEKDQYDLPYIQSIFDFVGENVDGQWQYNNYRMAGFPEENYK